MRFLLRHEQRESGVNHQQIPNINTPRFTEEDMRFFTQHHQVAFHMFRRPSVARGLGLSGNGYMAPTGRLGWLAALLFSPPWWSDNQ